MITAAPVGWREWWILADGSTVRAEDGHAKTVQSLLEGESQDVSMLWGSELTEYAQDLGWIRTATAVGRPNDDDNSVALFEMNEFNAAALRKIKGFANWDDIPQPAGSTAWIQSLEFTGVVPLDLLRDPRSTVQKVKKAQIHGAVVELLERAALVLTGNVKADAKDRTRVRQLIKDWQQHKRNFEDTTYWLKRFNTFEPILAKYRPKKRVTLYRNERTDIDNKYSKRFTSWAWSYQAVEGFGWGKRRLVECTFEPDAVVADLLALGLDTEHFTEVIVRPGDYNVTPVKWAWDHMGMFNVNKEQDRAKRAGIDIPLSVVQDS